MYFYEVWVRSHRYQNQSALTYSSEDQLAAGAIVQVPLQKTHVLAIVYRQVSKPRFACKPIAEIIQAASMPPTSIELYVWLHAYYPSSIGSLTQLFLPASIPSSVTRPSEKTTVAKPVDLNEEQQAALQIISGDSGTHLVHGRTGSGKTRLYAALAQQTLQAGRSVLILSPEISLTPQLIKNIEQLLGTKAVVLHSKLTVKERGAAWLQIARATEPLLVIGARSALFVPLQSVGLIVLDEFHEPAYKQEQQPYYYAPRVAAKLAQIHDATLVLGSATPPVSEYYLAQQKKRPIIPLRTLASGHQPAIRQLVIDIKDRASFSQKSSLLSDQLITALKVAISRGEQAMLYLNRRGTARLSLCQNCGWQALCPQCDIPMTYHGDSHTLLCHTCGTHQPSPTACPTCGHTDIVLKSAGTKAVADEVQRLLPEARVQRFDTDNLKADRFEQHYEHVLKGSIDILVGTQLLAKGLDLPKLTTLGIVLADSSLSIPDFTSQERTFQLIQQVMGRIGRGHTPHATAIIQTYNPGNTTLRAALNNDWQDFYDREISERQKFDFPPFCHLLKLVCKRKSAASAETAGKKLAVELTTLFGSNLTIEGPTPCFHEKLRGEYHWQIVIRAHKRSMLLDVLQHLPKSGWSYDIDPINLL